MGLDVGPAKTTDSLRAGDGGARGEIDGGGPHVGAHQEPLAGERKSEGGRDDPAHEPSNPWRGDHVWG